MMFLSNVNYAVPRYSGINDGVSVKPEGSRSAQPIAPQSVDTTSMNPLDGIARLLGELEQLLLRLSTLVKADKPLDKPPLNPARFIRGTAADTGVKPGDVFRDFYQQTEGNCVTISAIKVAMMKFGHNPHGIYKTIQATDTGYHIVMRDGFKLDITHEELEQAQKGAGFRANRPNDVLVNAQFLYAVSAKRAYLENNDGIANQSFDAAMRSLNDGEYPGQALRRLGLKSYVVPATVQDFKQGAIGTISDSFHSMAVINGLLDVYGHKSELSTLGVNNHSFIGLKLL